MHRPTLPAALVLILMGLRQLTAPALLMGSSVLVGSAILTASPAAAQSDSVADASPQQASSAATGSARTVQAVRVGSEHQVEIDGILDEPVWETAMPMSGFTQSDPVEGAEPTEQTIVRVVYDEEAIYIGARLFDSASDSIIARLGRRDADLKSDHFVVFLDPYDDGRSGYYFGVNAAGTLYDGVLLNDDWDDSDWDGVWQGRTTIDEDGWTAEIRIPYSQIRFYQQDEYVWGINFRREIARKNERIYLVYRPRQESGFVSRFWNLTGMSGITPSRQIEITPYVTSKGSFTDQEAGNPFNDGSDFGFDAGADIKMGLTSNLTLNATVNPDFGQVEVDPAVINLSDNETFFPEKRPFFIEGNSTFNNFGYGGASDNWGFNWGNPQFFYSRRIGRAPQGGLPDHQFADVPEGARILGAAKLTGQVFGDLNVGTVHAFTAREHADLFGDGGTFRAEVEPATYYGVYRGQKEFNESRQGIGFMGTVVNRFIADERMEDQLNTRAFTLGGDGWTFLDRDKTWVINGWAGATQVRGTEEQMLALQQNSLHYFQRPDASHVSVDSSAASMSGWAGRIALNKQRGRIMMNTAVGAISPGFDVNDLGFMFRTDVINGHFGFGYRWPDPGRFTRNANVIGAVFQSMDFEGNSIWRGVWGRVYAQLLNYYEGGIFYAYNPETVNNRLTRGGPLTLNPPGWELGGFMTSDSRKPYTVGLQGFSYRSDRGTDMNLTLNLEWKPASNASVMVSPSMGWNYADAQWVEAFDDPLATATFGRRYVFAELDQLTLSSSVRLNWTFTPQLSFQLYAQPLISAGDYYGYKELARARSYDFVVYGKDGGSTMDEASLVADPDGDGPAPALDLPSLDFNFTSLRGTAVMRWEYLPGSILYLVWTQQMSDSSEDGRFRIGPAFDQLRGAPMDNIFMVKLTYWLSR